MNKSDSIKELAAALSKAQGQIKGALKDSSNPFFKSKYADLSSVVEAIREPLASNGISYVQIAHDSDSSAKIETVILHSSGEWFSCGSVAVPVSKADAQGFGSAMTYARRYSLSAAFGVAPEDDDGNAAAKNPPKPQSKDDTPGKIVDLNLAMEQLTPEQAKAVRDESAKIAGDFYTISARAALGSWTAFKKIASEAEIEACWKLLGSTVCSGIKKAGKAPEETADNHPATHA
jgi:hypothetical protein